MLASNATTSAPKSTVTVGLAALPPCAEAAHDNFVKAVRLQLVRSECRAQGRQCSCDLHLRKQQDQRPEGFNVQHGHRQHTLRGDSSRRMPRALGVMSGSANDAVKSDTSAGPRVSCGTQVATFGLSAPSRGLVDLRSAGMQLALKACGLLRCDQRSRDGCERIRCDKLW